MKHKLNVMSVQFAIIFVFLALWEYLSRTGIISSFIFSSPSKVFETTVELISNGELSKHLYITTSEIAISFTLGIVIAFLISMIMYIKPFVKEVFDPFLTMLNSMPKVALGPIIIIWAGANAKSIILMALLINVIISIITLYTGFMNTDETQVKLFKMYGANKTKILFKLVLPANVSTILSAFKINISLTFIGVIMGEFLVSKGGLGYLILYGTQVFNLNLVITGIFILILLSYALYKVISFVEKKLSV